MKTKRIVWRAAKTVAIFLVSVLVLSLLVFVVSRLAPGDPLVSFYGERAEKLKPAERAAAEARLGLDQPILRQYALWLKGALRGEFGISYKYKMDVLEVIRARLPFTLRLGGIGFLLTFFLALGLGVLCARHEDKGLDRALCKIGTVTSCIPEFWLSLMLILLFSVFEKNILIGPVRELFAFSWKQLGEFCTRALPVMSNEGLWALGMLTLNRIYANMGYEYYAGMTIFKTFSELAFAFFVGLGGACVIMVGKSIGQGKIRCGVADARRFSVLVPLMGLIVGLAMIAARHPLVSLFAAGDNLSATTISTAYAVTIFCSLEYCFRNISYVQVVGVFRSGGDTLTGMLFDLGSLWFVSIPLALLAARVLQLPFIGVVIFAYLGEDIPKSILCLLHFKSMRWIRPVTEEGRAGLRDYQGK